MSVKDNILDIQHKLPENVKLVAVSKTKPIELLMEAYDAGQRIFGENKVQEITTKYETLPKDIQWHFIGHLQSNKVKYIAPFVNLIHAVDTIKLLKYIDKEAQKNQRTINCLLQFKIAQEDSKFGIDPKDAAQFMSDLAANNFRNVCICGVMGMATYTNDEELVRKEFHQLKEIFHQLKINYYPDSETFSEISMGMSHDYPIAIDEGATLIRIGTTIFGERNYNQPQ